MLSNTWILRMWSPRVSCWSLSIRRGRPQIDIGRDFCEDLLEWTPTRRVVRSVADIGRYWLQPLGTKPDIMVLDISQARPSPTRQEAVRLILRGGGARRPVQLSPIRPEASSRVPGQVSQAHRQAHSPWVKERIVPGLRFRR
jgi:hypothetical protein